MILLQGEKPVKKIYRQSYSYYLSTLFLQLIANLEDHELKVV